MLRDITIGRYINTTSLLHRADARTKIIAALIYSAAAAACGSLYSIAAITIFTVAAITVSHIPFSRCIKGLKPLRWFILFAIIINLFTADGNILWKWRVLHITDSGILTAAVTAMKLILFVIGTSLLTLTTRPIALTDGLALLMSPLKYLHIPTDDIAMIISITLRFIPSVADEADKIMKAQRARGADFESVGIRSRLHAIIPVTIPLLISVFKKSDELSLAMDIRCYGKGTRRPYKKSKFSAADLTIAVSVIVFCTFLAFIEIFH